MRTADDDYVTARCCNMNGLDTTFLWLGVHSQEKYLKAALLMNGQSACDRGHNISKLHDDLTDMAGDLLSDRLAQPEALDVANWLARTPSEFLKQLLANGNADNRYGIYAYKTRSRDLHMLDQMIFAIRRLVCPLDDQCIQRQDLRHPSSHIASFSSTRQLTAETGLCPSIN